MRKYNAQRKMFRSNDILFSQACLTKYHCLGGLHKRIVILRIPEARIPRSSCLSGLVSPGDSPWFVDSLLLAVFSDGPFSVHASRGPRAHTSSHTLGVSSSSYENASSIALGPHSVAASSLNYLLQGLSSRFSHIRI